MADAWSGDYISEISGLNGPNRRAIVGGGDSDITGLFNLGCIRAVDFLTFFCYYH